MKNVQTVLGEIAPEDMGFVLPHEHVFHDIYEITMSSHMILSDPVVARQELAIFKEKGGTTIVDQTVHGLNAEPEMLRAVAADVGINIVAGHRLLLGAIPSAMVGGHDRSRYRPVAGLGPHPGFRRHGHQGRHHR